MLRIRPRSRLHAGLLAVLAGLAVFTVLGLVELWPTGREITSSAAGVLATE